MKRNDNGGRTAHFKLPTQGTHAHEHIGVTATTCNKSTQRAVDNETEGTNRRNKRGSYETHNRCSAVNLLISGGITPVSLLLFRYLLSQNGEQSFYEPQRTGQVYVLHCLELPTLGAQV
jgi:hypothetical protein